MDQVRKACAFIQQHADAPITLARIAKHVNASPFHFQRVFTRLVGISPRAYQDALRAGRFRRELREGMPVTGALYDAGYGSSSRVYERSDMSLGMTPATYQKGGAGAAINFTIVESPLGRLLLAATTRGVCRVMIGDSDRALEADLKSEYPQATISRDDRILSAQVRSLISYLRGGSPHPDLPIDVRATAFQWRVWRELQAIPYGETRTYREVASAIGRPTATRAVARACATNPIALLIPCHRVIRTDGSMGGYRWGIKRKERLLEQERTRRQAGGPIARK